jgi:DNA-binding SARP family transcriptional activator
LAAACPLPVTADRLALIIWKKGDDVSPNAVYTAVSRLRTQLAGTALDDAIVTDGLGYRLTTDPRRIDLVQFEQTGRSLVLDRQSSDISALRAAIEAYTAEPFPATKNEFLIQWKNRLRETRSRLVEILVVALIKGGRAGDAVELCHDLVAEEPWRESTWSLLVIALYRAGRANDALEAHRTARDQLREVLGLDPGPGLAELEVHVLRHDPLLLDDDWLEKAVAGLTARNLRGRGDSTSSGRLA